MISVFHQGQACEMPEEALIGPFEGTHEDDQAFYRWYELYLCRCHGDVVKRSAHITLRHGLEAVAELGGLGG